MMRIKDNSLVSALPAWFLNLANLDIRALQKQGFIIFPPNLNESEDLDEQFLLEYKNGDYRTTNLIGWLAEGDDKITIHSRFDDEKSDFFLNYMLQKVLKINVINFNLGASDEQFYDLLIYLFPYYLHQALKKGIYKEYQRFEYNDFSIKGSLDIARHIKKNIPFLGKVAYQTHEFSYDNAVNQIIRHTIEFIKLKQPWNNADFQKVREVTLSFKKSDLSKMLSKKISIKNPYFHEYIQLLQICKIILRREKQGIGENKNFVKGILIDASWLWEEYLATILRDYQHPKSNESLYLQGHSGLVRPDFYNDKARCIIDTKYKKVDSGIKRMDRFQIISYLHYRNATRAGLLYPGNKTKYETEGMLKGYGGEIFKISLAIPQNCESYESFSKQIEIEENILLRELEKENKL